MENKEQVKTSIGELISPKLASDIAGVSMNTLREWDKRGLIDSYRTDGGHRRYSLESLNKHLGRLGYSNIPKESIIYASAPETEEKELNLRVQRMKEFCSNKKWDCRVVYDIGCNRDGLLELVGLIETNKVERIILSHTDGVLDIGFDVIKEICKWHSVEISVISRSYMDKRREEMKVFNGLNDKMMWDLKMELSSYFEDFKITYDEMNQDDWNLVVNNDSNTIFSKNDNGDSHILIFKRFAYNETYISGSLELMINDKQKETGYVIFDRVSGIANFSDYQIVLNLWNAVRAYRSLMHLQYECGENGIFDGNESRLENIINRTLLELAADNPFESIEQFVDILSVCDIEEFDIEDILDYIYDLEPEFVERFIEDFDCSEGRCSELASRILDCRR